MGRVAGAVPLGDEHLDGRAQQLFAGIAEEPLRLGVDEDQSALLVHDDHGVGRGFQQLRELRGQPLALAQVGEVGDVAIVLRDQRPALGVLHGPERHRDGHGRAVLPPALRLVYCGADGEGLLDLLPGLRRPLGGNHQVEDRPAQRFLARVPEQDLGSAPGKGRGLR